MEDFRKSDLTLQFSHLWTLFSRLVREFGADAWIATGSAYIRPARTSLHILGATKYYIEDSRFETFPSGRTFDLDWTTAPNEVLPSQKDILDAIEDFKKSTDRWISTLQLDDKNLRFGWCGASKESVVVYLLRHSHYHLGELNLLLQLSKSGKAQDFWDATMV